MHDLDTRLGQLGARWDAPPTPDLVDAVMRREPSAPARRTRPRRTILALAASIAALGALAAIAPARNAILDFFDVGGVRVTTTPTAPQPPPTTGPTSNARFGSTVSLAAARTRSSFPLLLPALLAAPPDGVFVQTTPPDGAFAFVWSDAVEFANGQLVLTQFRGQLVATKTVDPALTTIDEVAVDGTAGFWLSGGPHTIGFVDEDGTLRTETTRTVGDVLVWERSGVTYRIEGASDRDTALRIAASLR